jgi:hypothetical protein
MRIYYRGPDAMVTSELFVRGVTTPASYAICDLRQVGISSTAGSGPARTPIVVAVGLTGLAASAIVLFTGALILTVPLLVVTLIAATVAVLWPRRPGRWELQATYQGRAVILYATSDVTTFNQVARALRRALEDDRRPPTLLDAA